MPSYNSNYTGAEIDESVSSYLDAKNNGGYIDANTLANIVATVKLTMFPVGSIYMSIESTNPSTFIGGTWQRIQDTFLLAAGSTYAAGSSGGNASHTHGYAHTHTTPATTTGSTAITADQMPSHGGHVPTGTWSGKGSYYFDTGKALSLFTTGAYGWTVESGNEIRFYRENVGGGGGHTHGQVATTTNSQSTSTTDSGSSLPPYIAVYVWKRTA